MLVLSRNIQQAIQIGDDICIRVLSVNRNQIRLGISAPEDVLILREEIIPRYQRNNSMQEES